MDRLIKEIADYAAGYRVEDPEALEAAAWVLLDSLGCAALATREPEATKFLGPVEPGTHYPVGARVIATPLILDPVSAARATGILIRWLDYNDTWLAAEWGHPSDNLGTIIPLADWLDRRGRPLRVAELLGWTVKAHEIQGVLSLNNSLNRVGIDHVLYVKVASAAVATGMLGGGREEVASAVSNAWLEATLRTYRHYPNTGPRKSWAAGDATSRGLQLALWAMRGMAPYPTALSAPKWGFQEVWFGGKQLSLVQPLGSFVIKNVLFKPYPAEYHSQTALEAALQLHPQVKDRIDEIKEVRIRTHESAIRIIDKKGPLKNPADRDHCIQYVVAVGLIYGKVTPESYSDEFAKDPRIDWLRERTAVEEEPRYSRDYMDPEKRTVANSVEVVLGDGTRLGPVEVEYPLGHPKRRGEMLPVLREKARRNLGAVLPARRVEKLLALFEDPERLYGLRASQLVDMVIP